MLRNDFVTVSMIALGASATGALAQAPNIPKPVVPAPVVIAPKPVVAPPPIAKPVVAQPARPVPPQPKPVGAVQQPVKPGLGNPYGAASVGKPVVPAGAPRPANPAGVAGAKTVPPATAATSPKPVVPPLGAPSQAAGGALKPPLSPANGVAPKPVGPAIGSAASGAVPVGGPLQPKVGGAPVTAASFASAPVKGALVTAGTSPVATLTAGAGPGTVAPSTVVSTKTGLPAAVPTAGKPLPLPAGKLAGLGAVSTPSKDTGPAAPASSTAVSTTPPAGVVMTPITPSSTTPLKLGAPIVLSQPIAMGQTIYFSGPLILAPTTPAPTPSGGGVINLSSSQMITLQVAGAPVALKPLPTGNVTMMSFGSGMVAQMGPNGQPVGPMLSGGEMGVFGRAYGTVVVDPAALNKSYTAAYASKPTSELQSILATRKPSDADYVTLQNMVTLRAADPMSSVPAPKVEPLLKTVTPTGRAGPTFSYRLANGETLAVDARAVGGTNASVYLTTNLNVPGIPVPKPTGKDLADYFTKQYASKSVPDLQALLAKRKPSDPDYAALSNLISANQYTASALTAYSPMTIDQLRQLQPSMKSETDKAIISSLLVEKYKADLGKVGAADLNNAMNNGAPIEQRVAMSQVYQAGGRGPKAPMFEFDPIVVTYDTAPPPRPTKSPLCSGISMGCMFYGIDAYTAPKPLLIAETVLVGAVVGLAALPVGGAAGALAGGIGASLGVSGALGVGLAGVAVGGTAVAGIAGVAAGAGAGGVLGVLNSI